MNIAIEDIIFLEKKYGEEPTKGRVWQLAERGYALWIIDDIMKRMDKELTGRKKPMEIFVKKVMVAKFEGHDMKLYDTQEEAGKSLIKYQAGLRLKTLVDSRRSNNDWYDNKDDILRFMKDHFDALKAICDTKYDIREM